MPLFGLVVLLSTTKNVSGTPFKGPGTNLAGLFQITGTSRTGDVLNVQNVWIPGKALFGKNVKSKLTAFVVAGKAPAYINDISATEGKISAITNVTFTIAGEKKCYTHMQYNYAINKICKRNHPKQEINACVHAVIKNQLDKVKHNKGMTKMCT